MEEQACDLADHGFLQLSSTSKPRSVQEENANGSVPGWGTVESTRRDGRSK